MDQQIVHELSKDPESSIVSLLNTVREQSRVIELLLKGLDLPEHMNIVKVILPSGHLRIFAIKKDGAEIAWADIDFADENTAIWNLIEVK